jgi:hypothetical protein
MFAPARHAGTKTLEALLRRGLKEFPGIGRNTTWCGTYTRWKAPPFHGAHPQLPFELVRPYGGLLGDSVEKVVFWLMTMV